MVRRIGVVLKGWFVLVRRGPTGRGIVEWMRFPRVSLRYTLGYFRAVPTGLAAV